MKVDTSTIDQELVNHEKQLRQYYSTKSKLMEEIDSLDPDDRHYIKRKADLDDRLYRMYDKIEEEENLLVEARAKKQAIEAEKLTADNIYKVLIYFEKLYGVMNDVERRRFIEALISEIQIFPERQPNGQWLKSIKFKLPIIGENMELSLDNDKHVETVAVLSRKSATKTFIPVTVSPKDMGLDEAKAQPTYENIRKYVKEAHGLTVSTLNIAQMKAECGLEMECDRSGGKQQPKCPPEKREAILDAFRHFGMIEDDSSEG